MSDILVYTAIFGNRDVIKFPKLSGLDFRAVTDSEVYADKEGVIVTPPPVPNDPRRSARYFKTMPQIFFPGYRRWIWMDGSVSLRDGVDGKALLWEIEGPLATFKHREHHCAYQEAESCMTTKIDNPDVIRLQKDGYEEEGFPRNAGLGETMVVVRDNTPGIRAMNRAWWREVSTKSVRDQISFNYVAWKWKVPVHYMGVCTGTPWFNIGSHASVDIVR